MEDGEVVCEGAGCVEVAVGLFVSDFVGMRWMGDAYLTSAGELSSPVKEERFAKRRVLVCGGPTAEVLENSVNAGGKVV